MLMVIIFGAIGGIANILILQSNFVLPKVVITAQNKKTWDPGFINGIVVGIVAALVTYFLGTPEVSNYNQMGIALISGIGGGNILTSYIQKNDSTVLNNKVSALEDILKQSFKS